MCSVTLGFSLELASAVNMWSTLGMLKSDFSSQVKPQVKSRAQKFCQVKSGQNLVKSSSQVIKSSRLEHPYRCSSQLFSNQVKSQVKSRGRICFKSSHDQVKSGQNFGQVIKSSHQVKQLEHPYHPPLPSYHPH